MPRRRSPRDPDFGRTIARTRQLVEQVQRTADAVHRAAEEAHRDAETARRTAQAARRQSRAQIGRNRAEPPPAAGQDDEKHGPADGDPPRR